MLKYSKKTEELKDFIYKEMKDRNKEFGIYYLELKKTKSKALIQEDKGETQILINLKDMKNEIVFVHELLHLKFYILCPIKYKQKEASLKVFKDIIFYVSIALNNLIHHLYISNEIDNYYNLNRKSEFNDYIDLYNEFTINYNKIVNNVKLTQPNIYIQQIFNIVDMTIRKKNQRKHKNIIATNDKKLLDIANDICNEIFSIEKDMIYNFEKTNNKILSDIQSIVTNELGLSLNLKRFIKQISPF